MPTILCIETSTTMCSVAIGNEQGVLMHKETNNGYTHAENLHVFIDEVLTGAAISKSAIDAVCVGKGPGSYTGLRIGVSTAKGIAYALNIPLISMNTLLNLSVGVMSKKPQSALLCPMLDARRMEVYTALYDTNGIEVAATKALIINETSMAELANKGEILLFGDGATKCKDYCVHYSNITFLQNQFPSALNMIEYSVQRFQQKQFEDVAYFEPFYLKEFYTGK